MADDNNSNNLQLDLTGFNEELRKQQQYGDRDVEAVVGEALSSATFGATDVLATTLGVATPEQLREVRERSPLTPIGTAAGIIGPAIATGGATAAAKAVSAPMRAVMTAGQIAENAAAKVLPNVAGKGIATAATRNAVEGGVIGAGQLASDIALQKRDLSAESIAATVGMGALTGAGFGTLLGTAQASVPKLLKGSQKIGQATSQAFKEGIEPLANENHLAASLMTKSPKAAKDLLTELRGNANYLGKFVKDDLQYSGTETLLSTSKKLDDVISTTGREIDEITDILQEQVLAAPQTVTRKQLYQPVLDKLNELKSKVESPSSGPGGTILRAIRGFEKDINEKMLRKSAPSAQFAAEKAVINKELDDILRLAKFEAPSLNVQRRELELRAKLNALDALEQQSIVSAPADFIEYNNLRKFYDEIKWKRGTSESFSAQADIAKELRTVMQNVKGDLARTFDSSVPGLSARLKEVNKRFSTAKTVKDYVDDALRGAPDLSSPMNYAWTAGARVARNVALLNDIGQKVSNVSTAITKGIQDSLKKVSVTGEYRLPALQVLTKSGLAIGDNDQKPKTRLEAFDNVAKNVTTLANDPDAMVELLASKTIRIANANPEIASILQQRLTNAVQFLNSKLPKSAVNQGAFQRKYQPSSLELAKFERYLQVVEQPLTALEELKQGTLTREHVEALQVVYPEIYRQIQVEVMDKIAQGDIKLSYERKLQFGILLNIPADSSLTPESVMMLQQSIKGAPEQAAAPGPQFRPSGMEKTGISSRAETEVEKISNRE